MNSSTSENFNSSVASFTTFTSTTTFASFDGLRALAILGVLWHHSTGGVSVRPTLQRGFLGVDLFFTVSGFLSTCHLSGSFRRSRDVYHAIRYFP
jgi:peptidoglycan/LPS O-acetylase OafA/YrhL